MVTPIPYVAVQQTPDDAAPWGILGYENAVYLDTLPDAAIEITLDQLPRKQSPMSFCPILPIGGAFTAPAEDGTALGGVVAAHAAAGSPHTGQAGEPVRWRRWS